MALIHRGNPVSCFFQLTSSAFHVPMTNTYPPEIRSYSGGYLMNVEENQLGLASYEIYDADVGAAGKYGGHSITPDFMNDLIFSSATDMGITAIWITLSKLDYESVQSTSFNLTVWDNAPHPFEKKTTVTIQVVVSDVDDECPELQQNITSKIITIYENETFILN